MGLVRPHILARFLQSDATTCLRRSCGRTGWPEVALPRPELVPPVHLVVTNDYHLLENVLHAQGHLRGPLPQFSAAQICQAVDKD